MTAQSIPTAGSWRELLGRGFAPISAVLAGGVLLEASNVYLTTSLLPTIVDEIGGAEFYAWTMASFLIASVVSAMLVSRVLTTQGAVRSYTIALSLFAAGSLVCALSVSMPMLLVGRGVQGLGGGLLAGLGYALIQRALPERLWARAGALVSAMWGVGNILGPVVGGGLAEFDAWRVTFVGVAVIALALVPLVLRSMPRTTRARSNESVPIVSLALLTAAVAAVCVAGIVPSGLPTALAIGTGVLLAAVFIANDRFARARVLPAVVFDRRSPLRWVYLTVAVLAFGIGTEAFLPLFGQEIGAMSPLVAGLLGAALSMGWSIVQVVSANAERPRAVRTLIVAGPAVLAVGMLGYGLLQAQGPGYAVITGWFLTLLLAGAGIGLAFPHLTVAAMGSTTGEEEGAKAASGINTVFIIANAFSSALAGVLVNLGSTMVGSAQLLMFTFAALAVLGVAPAYASARQGIRERAAAAQ